MVLGMLYSMRQELGVGVLTQTEVLQRAKDIIPGLQRVGNDLLTNFINNNLDEFYPELIDLFKENAKARLLGKNILKELKEIKREDGKDYKKDVFAVISRNRGEVTRLLVNNRHIDGFGIGEIFGGVIKRTGSEKKIYDSKNIDKLNLQTGDENAAMNLLVEGKEITDPKVRDRVERTMKKTSRLWKFTQRSATKAKIAFQDKLFYSEGESPWLAPPSLATEGKSAAIGATAAISFGHMVNYVMEDPVNRGVQAGLFVAGYFVTKEGGAYIKEINIKKKELGLVKPKQRGKPLSEERKRYKVQYKKELKEYKGQIKLIKREVGKKFWHNKGKLLYSSGSYLITSIGVNYLLNKIGLSGPEAPMVLAATNMAVSGLLSAGGMRSGAEFVVNSRAGKKVVDVGMELLAGKKQKIIPKEPKPKFHFKNRILEVPYTYIKNKAGNAYATNIAPRIERVQKKIEKNKFVKEILNRHEDENRQLQILERFVNNRNNPNEKFSKDELIDAVEFLNWMKEEEGMLLIHNPRFYSNRRINRPDGSVDYIDNREGLGNVDRTRKEVVEFAQNNLSKEEYDEIVDASLDFFADVKSIRQKVFHKRMKYLIASYGYRVTFMVMSHALQSQGGLLEEPMNKIFGNATMDYQHIIEQSPTSVFHADVKTPQGQEALAKEVWARAEELNNLVNLMGSSEQLSEFQPGLESHLAYYGINQQQIELLINNLKKNNLNSSDLMRVIYVLSSYKEGQEYFAQMGGFEGTERRNLVPLIVNIAQDPVGFMNRAMADKENATLILLKYPDIAEKLRINPESLADQLKPLVIPQDVKDQILAGMPAENPIIITSHGPQVISVGSVAAEFVDGVSKADRQSRIDLLTQFSNFYKSDTALLQQAVNHNFNSFLSESNDLVGKDLSDKLINNQPIDSMMYKIYHAFGENGQVIPLLNRAKDGDVNAYNQLYQLLETRYPNDKNLFHGGIFVTSDHSSVRDQILDSQADTTIYDKILNNLPGEEALRKEEIIRRLQQEMIGMGLRPVSAPIMDLTEMTDLAKDPAIFVDPREALIRALSPDNSDLEMAVSLTGNTRTLFVQNEQVVGDFKTDLQFNVGYIPEDLAILKAIEGAESDNNKMALPTIIGRNLSYVFGFRETASGATPPAGSLIEMITGPFGHGAMNPEAPSALHNYDAYGPGYLSKLIVAHFRGRVPEELLAQMGPDADLTKSIGDKDPSIIDRFCNKFETLIAEKVLVAKYGEDKVLEVFLNHVTLGTADGIELKGVEAVSQVLFAKPFKDLTLGEKFLIEALGQSPGEYLYDNTFDQDENLISSVPNPAKAIRHAFEIIERGKIGDKLDKYLPPSITGGLSGKDQILTDLHAMDDRVKNEGWDKVFNMHLTADVQNFAATPDAARFTGMTDDQIAEAIKNGEIKGVTFTNSGIRVVELNNITIEETSRAIPENLMIPQTLTGEQNIEGQLATQYSAMLTDAKLDGNFYTTSDGTQVPAWWTVFKDQKTGQMVENVVPGMAIVEIGPDGAASVVDPTNTLSNGPQLFGSSFKPLIVYSVLKLHPELNLGEQQFNAVSTNYQGQFIANAAHLVDNQGTLDLRHALSASANVPMVDMWTKLSAQDPNLWQEFQQLSKDQFGIHFYELKGGKYTEVTTDPFIGNAALPVGNIFVGGAKPEASGMIQMAEFYQKLGEMSVEGDPAASYVTDALGNDKYKADVDIWGLEMRKYFDGVIAKTGSQQGFDPVTGEPMAIRNIVAMVKIGPEGEVTTTLVLTGGIKSDGNATELGWGSNFLPVARNILDGTGPQVSPQVTQLALNELFINPESGLNYHLGAVSVEYFYPLLKDLSSEDKYAYLREAIRTGNTKYLFVDLVGTPHDNIQTVAIHLIDKTGENKLITLNVSSNLIEPVGSTINHFAETTDQTAIYELLAKATEANPEKFGGLLPQLQSQGINFIPIHDYESSPALFTLHEQMVKNHMLFAGAEDAGLVMKQLGLDPQKTIFVNSETFDLYSSLENQSMIAEQVFAQREYLALAAIYESSGTGNTLDTLLYTNKTNSNEIYQLLKVFIETKTSQTFVPVVSERSFLVNQFQYLIDNPEAAQKMAPDVIAAYNLYNTLSSQIARGEAPDPILSKQFIEAIKRFPETTNARTLLSLGIGINPPPPPISSTPLPQTVADSISVSDVGINSLKTTDREIVAAPEIVNNFLAHPEKFTVPEADITKAKAVAEISTAIVDIVNSSETQAIADKELRVNHIVEALASQGYEVKRSLVSMLVYDRQCVNGNLVLNNILVSEGLPGFVNMEGYGGDNAKSFAAPLIDAITDYRQSHPGASYVGISTTYDHLFMQEVDEIPGIKVGDTVIISAPWLGDNDVGHIAQVLFTGTHEDGSPYMLVYDTNADVQGTTAIREINDLSEFISEKAFSSQQYFPGSVPIYVVIRPEEQIVTSP